MAKFLFQDSKIYPDFVGIGATRAGSSWLHSVFANHPDIWVSPIKELHYYDRPMDGSITILRDTRSYFRRLKSYFNGGWDVNGEGLYKNLAWDYQYFFHKRSEGWYKNLFKCANKNSAGEITPAYAILDDKMVARLTANNHDLRVIYLLRNPIDRGWSSIVNGLAKKRRISIKNVPEHEILSKINKKGFIDRSNYAKNIRRWQNAVGNDRIFIGFFEDIVNQPIILIDQLCEFLNVRGAEMVNKSIIHKKRNASREFSAPMPYEIAVKLTKKLYPMIKDVQQMLGGYANQWLKNADNILNGEFTLERDQ
jgi:hypothetical protein